jgi:O-antigen ligase
VLGSTVGVAASIVEPVPLVAAAAAVIFMVGVLRSPMLGLTGFVVVATLLPFAVLPVRLFFAPTFVDITLSAFLCSWLIRAARRHESIHLSRRHVLLAAFMALATVSLILGAGLAVLSAEHIRLFLKLLNSLLFFVGVVHVVRSEESLAHITRVFILGATAAAIAGLALAALPREQTLAALSSLGAIGYPTGADVLRPLAGTETLRATGTSVDPNVFGALLMIAGIFVASQGIASKPVLPRWALVVSAACVLPAIALTFSRSAWIGLAAGVALLAGFKDRRLLFVIPVAATGLLLTSQGQTLIARLKEAFELRDQATLMRLSEYGHALQIIGEHPFFGVGFGNAPRVDQYVGVSSMYLLIAEHTGIVGLSVFLATVGAIFIGSLTVRPPAMGAPSGILSGLQAAVVGALVASLFDQYFFSIRLPHMSALFWLLLGLLAAASREAQPNGLQGPDPPRV